MPLRARWRKNRPHAMLRAALQRPVCVFQSICRTGFPAPVHGGTAPRPAMTVESPLWNIPNVIVTPHNASAASGNDRRAAEIFTTNIARWARGERLVNEQSA